MSRLLCLVALFPVGSVEEVLEEHQKTLARIQSIHCQAAVGDLPPVVRYEIWSAGDLTRTLQRTLSNDKSTVSIRQDWYSDREGRSLLGWDPDAPFELPLDVRRQAGAFGQVRGLIGPRSAEGHRSHAWFIMGIDVLPGWSLTSVAEVSQFAPLTWDGDDPVLRVTASKHDFMVGTVVTLSRAHGYLVRQREWPDRGGKTTVREFQERDGITFPAVIEAHHSGGVTTTRVHTCEINQPIPVEKLTLGLPAGARVDEPTTGAIHLWGTDGPSMTFASLAAYDQYLTGLTKRGDGKQMPPEGRPVNPLLWINLLLIPLIAILFVVRRRLARHGD